MRLPYNSQSAIVDLQSKIKSKRKSNGDLDQRQTGSAKEGARSAAQAGCLLNAGPIQSRDLRRQSARFAEASQFLFSAVEDGTGGFENPRDARSDVGF